MATSFQIPGILYKKFPTETRGENFKVRNFVLYQPGEYPEHILLQLTGANTELIDSIAEGWSIKVDANVKGRKYIKDEKEQFFTTLTAWKIEVTGMTSAKPVSNDVEDADVIDNSNIPF